MFLMLLLCFLSSVCAQVVPENPCPNIFAYRQQGEIYYGDITIPYDGSKSLNLAVNISMIGLYQNLKLKLELLTPADQILSTSTLRYRINFPLQGVIPKITQISFNDRIYCFGPSEPVTTKGVTNLWANLVYKINEYTYSIPGGYKNPSPNSAPSNNLDNFEQTRNPFLATDGSLTAPPLNAPSETSASTTLRPVSVEEICGVANDIQTLVLNGEKTIDNEYPWLVAMFHRQGVSYEFQCTANLVSTRHVITAAHCVWFYKSPLIDKEDILLVLGRSDISHWASTGALIRTALEVIPHPNYQQGSGHCDVALVKMNEEVTFKPTIRPICLWAGDTNLKLITGSHGVVAGWGKSEEARRVVAVPRKVSLPVVSQETCLRSHSGFRNLTSEMTFCAGNKDGSGPCSGDSGAGFIVKKNGRWFLRGVVSTAIMNDDYTCNLNEFIVFSDVAKLKEWIKISIK